MLKYLSIYPSRIYMYLRADQTGLSGVSHREGVDLFPILFVFICVRDPSLYI